MTTFKNGPAVGARLMLRRAPKYLRAVQDIKGHWDALDQIEDEPGKDETVFAYVMVSGPYGCHIRAAKNGHGGFFQGGEYAICDPQPSEQGMRVREAWVVWVEALEKH